MGGTLTKSPWSRVAASTPVLVSFGRRAGWNAAGRGWGVRRAHCWVLRQPAEGSGHRVVPVWCLLREVLRGGAGGLVLEGGVFLD
jgi:hypothetical protein